MSVATEFAPTVYIPERARSVAPGHLATVTTLHRPSGRSGSAPLRLTRRGVVVLTAAVAVLAAVLVGAAWLSAPVGASRPVRASGADTVTVQPGESLWAIATRVAPQRDPRAVVADLQRVNHLGSATLMPGEVLRTH